MPDLGFLHDESLIFQHRITERQKSLWEKRQREKTAFNILPAAVQEETHVCKFILNTQWILIKCCRYVVLGFWACNEKSFVQTEFRLKSPSFFLDNIQSCHFCRKEA